MIYVRDHYTDGTVFPPPTHQLFEQNSHKMCALDIGRQITLFFDDPDDLMALARAAQLASYDLFNAVTPIPEPSR